MKIAVASNNTLVTEHFGHCKHFIMFETSEKEIIKSDVVLNPGHQKGFLPGFLSQHGVNVIISGGMGGSAIDLFNSLNIEVIVGASGEALDIVNQYLQGELKSTGSVCHLHQHHNDCH